MVRRAQQDRQSFAQPASECFTQPPSVFSPRRLSPSEGNLRRPRRTSHAQPSSDPRLTPRDRDPHRQRRWRRRTDAALYCLRHGLAAYGHCHHNHRGRRVRERQGRIAGNWKISIPTDAPCRPKDGATIHFAVNGKEHAATVRWSGGGAPLNPRVGDFLGAATATPTATATASKAPTTKATPKPTPKPLAKKSPTRPAFR